jgi:hypothetical protein
MSLYRHRVRAPWAEYALLALTIGAGVLLAWMIAARGIEFRIPAAKYYNSYSCQTAHDNRQTGATFRVLDLFRLNTNELVDRLCASAEIGARYSRVEVIWTHRDQLDLREIVNQSHELVLAKPEVLTRLAETPATVYAPLASYQEYKSQLISLRFAPELSAEFFAGKRLGLLDDPNSLSGYQIPKAEMRRAHIDESTFAIVYFKSHADLHRALFADRVDVIASYSAAYFGDDRAATKRIDLQSGLSGMQWYLHPALFNSAIHCELYRNLIRHPISIGTPSSIVKPNQTECASAG